MTIPPKYQHLPDCTDVSMELGIYSVPHAAALWCGIPPNEINEELSKSKEIGPAIFEHPYIPCLKPKCMILHNSIKQGELPHSREDGAMTSPGDIAAPHRRYLSRKHLREYIQRNFPNDKPSILFSEQERKSQIDVAEYNRMNAEYIKQQTEIAKLKIDLASAQSLARDSEAAKLATDKRLEKATTVYREQKSEIERLKAENEKLQSDRPIDDRTTLLSIIYEMAQAFYENTRLGNQNAIITHLTEKERQGLSESNLKAKFAEANRLNKSN